MQPNSLPWENLENPKSLAEFLSLLVSWYFGILFYSFKTQDLFALLHTCFITLGFQSYLLRFGRCLDGMFLGSK